MMSKSREYLAELEEKYPQGDVKWFLLKDHIVMEWDKKRADRGRRSWHFDALSPELGFTAGRPQHARNKIIGGLTILAASIIIIFSDWSSAMPLLAPSLFLLAIALLVAGVLKWRPDRWTYIYTKQSQMAAYITHSACDREKRESFEQACQKAIREHQERTKTTQLDAS